MQDHIEAYRLLKELKEINDPRDIINRLAKLYDERTKRKNNPTAK